MDRLLGREICSTANIIRRSMASLCGHRMVQKFSGNNGWIIGFISKKQEKGEPAYSKDIEKEFNLRRSTVSMVIKLMESKGLIERKSVEADGRLKQLTLTDKAKEIDGFVKKDIAETEQKIMQNISKEELEIFFGVMDKIKGNLEDKSR